MEIIYRKGLYILIKTSYWGPFYWRTVVDAFGSFEKAEAKKKELEVQIEKGLVSV